MILHPDDKELGAAVQLLGQQRGHAMLGCDWGHTIVITSAVDNRRCSRQARRVMVLHAGKATKEMKLCPDHAEVIMAITTPHADTIR